MTSQEENELASTIIDDDVAGTLADIKREASICFEMGDSTFIDYVLALAISVRFDISTPIWGFLIAPPSYLKTEVLNFLLECPWSYALTTLTPQALMSGWQPDKTGRTKNNKYSLLNEMSGKIVVMKDFTTILQSRAEDRTAIFGQLRSVYDGTFEKGFGMAGRVTWEGKIGLVAAVTPEIDRYYASNQLLGERCLYYRMEKNDSRRVASKVARTAMRSRSAQAKLKDLLRRYFTFFDADITNPDVYRSHNMNERIGALATLCVEARTGVIRSRNDWSNIEQLPAQEGPGRLTKQLVILGAALSMSRGIHGIDEGVYSILKKVALDMIPEMRIPVMRYLYEKRMEYPDRYYSVGEVVFAVGVPDTTMRYILDDLFLLGFLQRGNPSGVTKFTYQATDYFIMVAAESGVFDM